MSDDLFEPDEKAVQEFKEYLADPAARAAFVEAKQRYAANGIRRSYRHVLSAFSRTPWAIRQEALLAIFDILSFRMAGGSLSPDEIEARIASGRRTVTPSEQTVAVLPVHGPIMPKASMFTEISGATSIDALQANFRMAMASPEVKGIVLDIDSPGGQVSQVPEFAQEIRAARGKKPIVAVANTEAASAAYWLAAQADEIVASPSSLVGSIGVFAPHEDFSAAEEMAGVKVTLVSAGKYKTEANPHEPLSDEGEQHIQSLVDNYYSMFVSDVAKGRGVAVDAVRTGYGEGRVVGAKQAVAEGLADRVGTLEEVISGLLKTQNPVAGRAAAEGGAAMPLAAGPAVLHPDERIVVQMDRDAFANREPQETVPAIEAPHLNVLPTAAEEQPEPASDDVREEAEDKPLLLRDELRARLGVERGKLRST